MGVRVKKDIESDSNDEAARLLYAYLKHVQTQEKHPGDGPEKIILVLPDAEVLDRKRKAVRPPAQPPRRKKRA
jgi:hypothetical protein